MSPALKFIDLKSVSCSDLVLANSRFTAKKIKLIYGVKAEVCYPPVDTDIFKPLSGKLLESTRSKFGNPLILSGGRIAAVKRWEWLIEMMYHVKKEFPEAVLVITGEISRSNFSYVKWLIERARKLGVRRNIKFLGFKSLEELVKLYNAADVYVYSAPREDFGLCPVEAMACGTPVVVWNDGSGPCETVLEGKTGFRAEPYNIEDLAEKALKAIISFDKAKTGKFFPKYIKQKFSKEKHIKKLEEAILKVAG
jgi:glycosyltransferase involved in cell wall biosynthesis